MPPKSRSASAKKKPAKRHVSPVDSDVELASSPSKAVDVELASSPSKAIKSKAASTRIKSKPIVESEDDTSDFPEHVLSDKSSKKATSIVEISDDDSPAPAPPTTPSPIKKSIKLTKKEASLVDISDEDVSSPVLATPVKSKSKLLDALDDLVLKPATPKNRSTNVAVKMSEKKLKPSTPAKKKIVELTDTSDDEPLSLKRLSRTKSFVDDEAIEEVGDISNEDDDDEDELKDFIVSDSESIVPLDKDDSMYPSPKSSTKVRVSKRPAPITPPLKTRERAVKETLDLEEPTPEYPASPTKKRRVASPAQSMEIANKIKPFPKIEKTQVLVTDNGLAEDGSLKVYYEDVMFITSRKAPVNCQVANAEDEDPYLKKAGLYDNLPKLFAANVTPAKYSEGPGLVMFSSWKKVAKEPFNINMAAASISFQRSGRFVNLSRIPPNMLVAKPSYGSLRYDICIGTKQTAVCLTPILVVNSFLTQLNSRLEYSGHYLDGIFHTGELNRMFACVGMVTHQMEYTCQLWRDALTFGTRSNPGNANQSGDSDLPNIPGMFKPSASPVKKANGAGMFSNKFAPLEFGETIPIYDARGMDFDYNKSTFENPEKCFKLLNGEIPKYSLVVVAYITQLAKQNKVFKLFTYAQWGILLATQS